MSLRKIAPMCLHAHGEAGLSGDELFVLLAAALQ
jgi:hypothetical protein